MERKPKKGELEKIEAAHGYQVVEKECIWMKAGVINFRLCDNAFDCYTCSFDRGMGKAIEARKKPDEKRDGLALTTNLQKRFPGPSRPCRHTLTGRIGGPKVCAMDYECYHCPYDQMLDELDLSVSSLPAGYDLASGYRMARGYYYHMGHCWACIEHGGRIRVGLDDFLVRVFGIPDHIDLPSLGMDLKQSEVGLAFTRNENKAAVLAPVSGTVLAVNHLVKDHPEMPHQDPYGEGWLLVVEPEMPKKDLKSLFFEKTGLLWMDKEVSDLASMAGPEYEQLAATGGSPVDDFYGSHPDAGWDRLVGRFLRTEKR